MAENNEEEPQNPAEMDAFEDNDDVFLVRGDTCSMEKNYSFKNTYGGDPIQKTLSASRDSGIDKPDVQGDGAHMEELPRASQSDPGSNTKLGHLKTERRPPVPAPRGRAYVMENNVKCYVKFKAQRSRSTPVYINWPPPSQGQTSELPMSANDSPNVKLLADDSNHDNINNEASDKRKEPKYASILSEGRSRLPTNSWQERELRSIEEIERCRVMQTLEIFKNLQITRKDSLRMDGAILVGKDEKYFVSQGFTAFEARKLYKYVRGWRPKDQQQCKTNPSLKTINKWSAGDVQIVMNSPNVGLPQVGDFAAANQVDGLLLMDLVENKYMIGIEKDYGVKLSLLEDKKLMLFLEKKRQEIGLMAQSVAKVLEKLKLEKHVEAFKQQNIDSEKLDQMSESQLKKILTVFGARKLYKYLNQGWRPKNYDHSHKDLETLPVDDWSVNDVRNYLQNIELEELARFSCDNQIDGVMLRDLIKNNHLESLEYDYGVKISLGEFKKLNAILREIQHE